MKQSENVWKQVCTYIYIYITVSLVPLQLSQYYYNFFTRIIAEALFLFVYIFGLLLAI